MESEKLKYLVTPVKFSVHLKDAHPIFGEQVTHVILDDEGAGPFIVLEQDSGSSEPGKNQVTLDFEEILAVLDAIKKLKKVSSELGI